MKSRTHRAKYNTAFVVKIKRSWLKALAAPVLLSQSTLVMAIEAPANIRAVQVNPTGVVWEWDRVDGATSYEIIIDGQYSGLTPDTRYTTFDLWPGDHSISVKSIDQNNDYSEPSLHIRVNTVSDLPGADTGNRDFLNDGASNGPVESAVDPASYDYPEVYEKPGYELVFSDEFNTDTLSASKWNTQLRWDGEFNGERYEYRVINRENQFYVNIFSEDQEHLDSVVPSYNPFELDGTRLAIRAKRNPLKVSDNTASYGPLGEIVAQQDFLSGAISTYDKFTQKYGFFEARIKIPSQEGTFPAFWLHHQRRVNENTRKTEIDIMENLGHAPWYIYNTFHYYNNVSTSYSGDPVFVKPDPDGQIYNGTDFSLDYHTYAVKWEPGYIAWYIDDELVSEVHNDNVDHEELYLILNLAIGGNWTNYPANSGGLGRDYEDFFPNGNDLNTFSNPALEIDYVRVFERR